MVYHTDDGGDNGDNIREVHTNSKDHCQDGLELIFNEYLPFPYKSGFKIFVRAPKVPFFRTLTWALLAKKGSKKWQFGCRNKNSKTTFRSQNDGIAFVFKRLPLLDGF